MILTRKHARRVLEVVDAGLCHGGGRPEPGKMCVEQAVCFALGLEFSDNPECVAPELRALKIRLNDSPWSSNSARAKGMRRLAILQLGTRDVLDEKDFLSRVVDMTIRKIVPRALRSAASMEGNAKHKDSLEAAAVECEAEGTHESAMKARAAAYAAYAANAAAYDAAYAAYAAANAAADAAAAYAAYVADADAAYAAYAAANAAADAAAAYAAYVADAADAYAAYAAAYAAYAAANAAAYAAANARDKSLAIFAEEVVQILISMRVPAAKWIDLTEG